MSGVTKPEQARINQAVLEHLKGSAEPVSMKALYTSLGVPKNQIDLALKWAKRAGYADYVKASEVHKTRAGWVVLKRNLQEG